MKKKELQEERILIALITNLSKFSNLNREGSSKK